MTLSEISIRRPVFALMLTVGLVVLGLISLGRLEMQLDPDLEFPFANVTTELRGASPGTVETEVTDVLEEQINEIEGIRSLRSTSSEGLSQVMIEFGLDQDPDVKIQEVRDKVALARAFLPEDVEDPLVQKFNFESMPILTVMLGGPIPLRDLSDFAEHVASDRLERIPGVGGITVVGAREREIRIWLDPMRLAGYDLAIEDVTLALRSENAELASGRIEGPEHEWSVTTQGKVRQVDDFGALIVAERAGRLIQLRDVAVVEDGFAEARTHARLNGEPGVALEVRRQSGADTVAVARAVRAQVEALRSELDAGMHIRIARDYATYIEEQITSIATDMLVAGALVVLVVLVFLRSGRSTFIAALAIPSSLIASFTFFYALDLSLNSMTLIALSLAIGLVIDDAVVVLEAIFQKLEGGSSPMQAALEGSREVGLAVISTTLAVCAVFVPIAFMQSIVGRYFFEFGAAVTVAVCVSTLVALTLTPMLASRMLKTEPNTGPIFSAFERALDWLDRSYRRLLAGSLRHRAVTMTVGVCAVVGGCGVASTLPFDLFNNSDLGEISIRARLPVGTPLASADRALRRLEETVAADPVVEDVFAAAGDQIRHAPHKLSVDAFLVPKTEREPIETTFDRLREEIDAALPELERLSVTYPAYGGDSGSEYTGGLVYSLRGPDLDHLEQLGDQMLARMRDDPEFADVATSYESGKPQITLQIERASAADLGVPAVSLGRTIRTLLAGEKVGSFEDAGRRHDVRVQVLPEYRDDPGKLDLIRVRSLRGELVPIRSVARVLVEEGPAEILREDRSRSIQLFANLKAGVPLGNGAVKIDAWAEEIGVAPPVTLTAGGSVETMQETGADIVFAFGLALAVIYMVLASLFNSLIHPFTIMLSAPLSFIGAFVALAVSGLPLDMMSGIGLLVLMGLVMKNGILLVDAINQHREMGKPVGEAVLDAGPQRMRPVLMTSGALIFGMIPAATTSGVGSEFFRPMAVITIGGLLTSTLLTLVVVPVIYTLIESGMERARGLAGRLRARRTADARA